LSTPSRPSWSPKRTRRSVAQAELAIVEWVSWFNHDRLHSSIGDIPPVEFQQLYARRVRSRPAARMGSPSGRRLSNPKPY
jgi:transposase InsO family protein